MTWGLEVDGFGRVTFPVTPAKARRLLGLGQPARFGRAGRPYTLVLNKIDALFTREQETRARNETGLAWLEAAWNGK